MSIEVHPLRQLTSFLRSNDLYAAPWREAMGTIGYLGEQFAIRGAPFGRTGQLIAQLSYRVQASRVPRYVVVKTTAVNPKNHFGYPARQEFDPKMGHLDWLLKSIEASASAWGAILGKAAREIESRWSRLN